MAKLELMALKSKASGHLKEQTEAKKTLENLQAENQQLQH